MPPRKGQRQARGLARRQQILDTCVQLFAAGGYRGTSVATVASAVGITEAGVLHHFPSKDALILATLIHRDTAAPDAEAHVAEPGGGVESLRRIPTLARALLEQPALMRFDAVVQGEAVVEKGAIFEHSRARLHLIRRALASMLQEGVRRGELRADTDVDSVAAEILAFMSGIQIQWLFEPDRVDLDRVYRHYVDSLIEQLAVPARGSRPR